MSGKEVAQALANRPSKRFAAPGTAFCSTTTRGIRNRTAASPQGTLAYPPNETTARGLWRASRKTARNIPTSSPRRDATLAGVSRRRIPRPDITVRPKPAAGTRSTSMPRRLPTMWTSCRPIATPLETSASATARPGSTWPAVPPPATTNPPRRISRCRNSGSALMASGGRCSAGFQTP